ncbi:MAG TPA: fructokinase [Gammaproteobacteria bacterium]|nr:fructokinase [Gammaproteobacteria bacterium]
MNRIGIDLGGTKTEAVILDNQDRILARQRVSTPQAEGYEAVLDTIHTLVRQLETESGSRCSIGIGTPGAISAHSGLMRNSNTVCLNGKPLLEDFVNRLNRPIRLANDANCFALSESRNGAAREYASCFGIIMGTGVGGGIVINDRLHAGVMHIGGEWGHNLLEENGPPCYCGRKGCVETLLSGPGLSRDHHQNGGEANADPATIVRLAESGDAIAMATVERFLARFGRAVAAVINILDPHAIVLGGGMSNIDLLYTRGREMIEPHVFSDYFSTPVLRNEHGDSSGVLGAAQLWEPGEL